MSSYAKILACVCVLSLAAVPASACVIPPWEAYVPDDDLVARTGRIAVGLAKGFTPLFVPHHKQDNSGKHLFDLFVRYEFETIEVIKGQAPGRFFVDLQVAPLAVARDSPNPEPVFPVHRDHRGFNSARLGTSADEDFDGHRDPMWPRRPGPGIRYLHRAWVEPWCAVTTDFRVGARYLVFIDQPYHVRSFEQIIQNDDAWLQHVRSLVANQAR